MLGGYKNMQKKHGSAPGPDELEPKYCQKWPVFGYFWNFGAQGGPGWV